MKVSLITEYFDSVKVTQDKSNTLFVEGIFSSANLKNKNGRIYRKETLDSLIETGYFVNKYYDSYLYENILK
jgi:hypothetical protein